MHNALGELEENRENGRPKCRQKINDKLLLNKMNNLRIFGATFISKQARSLEKCCKNSRKQN
jgi:hypothetical protein